MALWENLQKFTPTGREKAREGKRERGNEQKMLESLGFKPRHRREPDVWMREYLHLGHDRSVTVQFGTNDFQEAYSILDEFTRDERFPRDTVEFRWNTQMPGHRYQITVYGAHKTGGDRRNDTNEAVKSWAYETLGPKKIHFDISDPRKKDAGK